MAQQTYDLLVIGAGAAGSTAATTAAQKGGRVAMVERDKIGGTCLNYGCDPTKTMIYIAKLLYTTQRAEQFGLQVADAHVQWGEVMSWVQQVIKDIRGGTSEEASKSLAKQGVEVIHGEAAFVSGHELTVDGRTLQAERIIIATGGKEVILPIEGLNEAGYITNVEAVSLPALPRRMAVIGGGAIGMEFAQMFSRFGVEITVLEHSSQLLDKEDREVAETLCTLLRKEGLRLETNVEVQRIQRQQDGKCLTIRCGDHEEEQLVVDEILLAVGRQPALESLHLEKAGVKTTEKGIEVDATLRTNVPHIWAAGDITGGLQFTHVAYEQGKIAAHNAFSQEAQKFDHLVIPWVTFTNPALAHVGKTEEQLKEDGVSYRAGRMYFKEVERAIAEGKTDGFVKLLVDEKGHILGGHILAAEAGNLLAPIILAMQAGLPAEQVANTIMPYPTLVEGVRWAADKL